MELFSILLLSYLSTKMRRKIVFLLSLLNVIGYLIIYHISTESKKQAKQFLKSIIVHKLGETQTIIVERTEIEKVQSVEEKRRVDQETNSEINELRKRIDDYIRSSYRKVQN